MNTVGITAPHLSPIRCSFFSLPDNCAHTRGAQIETAHMFSLTSCSEPHTRARCCGPSAQISSAAKVQTSKHLKPCLITATNDVSQCESFWKCDESRMWTYFGASCCVICPPQHLAKCDLTGWFLRKLAPHRFTLINDHNQTAREPEMIHFESYFLSYLGQKLEQSFAAKLQS